MAGELLRFPRRHEAADALAAGVRPDPQKETFPPAQARELLGVVQRIVSSGRSLVEFVDRDRGLARQAAIETIGIEVSSILGDDRMGRLLDALEESAKEGRSAEITLEGLSEMRRLERLVAEASGSIPRFTGGRLGALQHELDRPRLGGPGAGDSWIPWIAAGLGVALVAVVVVAVVRKK